MKDKHKVIFKLYVSQSKSIALYLYPCEFQIDFIIGVIWVQTLWPVIMVNDLHIRWLYLYLLAYPLRNNESLLL